MRRMVEDSRNLEKVMVGDSKLVGRKSTRKQTRGGQRTYVVVKHFVDSKIF